MVQSVPLAERRRDSGVSTRRSNEAFERPCDVVFEAESGQMCGDSMWHALEVAGRRLRRSLRSEMPGEGRCKEERLLSRCQVNSRMGGGGNRRLGGRSQSQEQAVLTHGDAEVGRARPGLGGRLHFADADRATERAGEVNRTEWSINTGTPQASRRRGDGTVNLEGQKTLLQERVWPLLRCMQWHADAAHTCYGGAHR